ncbi:MAG: hypothetical protein PHD19_03755 [Dechloromonas sp.]|jgi:hypothetical protein|nr:hypothetical protein [Dechloromonas sp.]
MFGKLNLAAGLLALALFAWAQHQGWNLFDDVAEPGRSGSGSSSRTWHK